MTSARAWLERRSAGAPAALRARAIGYLDRISPSDDPAEDLARAGRAALEATVSSAGDRSAALDLLAADGLVTLALLVQAETDPAGLARFAAGIRNAGAQDL